MKTMIESRIAYISNAIPKSATFCFSVLIIGLIVYEILWTYKFLHYEFNFIKNRRHLFSEIKIKQAMLLRIRPAVYCFFKISIFLIVLSQINSMFIKQVLKIAFFICTADFIIPFWIKRNIDIEDQDIKSLSVKNLELVIPIPDLKSIFSTNIDIREETFDYSGFYIFPEGRQPQELPPSYIESTNEHFTMEEDPPGYTRT